MSGLIIAVVLRVVLGIPLENGLTFLAGVSRARAQLARTLATARRLEIIAGLGRDSLMERRCRGCRRRC